MPFLMCGPVQCLNSILKRAEGEQEKGCGVSAVSARTGIEGKDNEARIIFSLCNANVGWLASAVVAPIISCAVCVSPLLTSNFCLSHFGQTVALKLLVVGHQKPF